MAGAEFMEGWAFWGTAKGRAWEGQQGRGIARVTGSEAQDLTTSPSSQKLRSGLEKSKAPNGFLVLTELQDSAWPQCTARPESQVLLHPKPLSIQVLAEPWHSEGHQWAQGVQVEGRAQEAESRGGLDSKGRAGWQLKSPGRFSECTQGSLHVTWCCGVWAHGWGEAQTSEGLAGELEVGARLSTAGPWPLGPQCHHMRQGVQCLWQ